VRHDPARRKTATLQREVLPGGDALHPVRSEIVFMYPWAVVYRDAIKQSGVIFWSMFSFISILMVGYVYALKKGALDFKR
jgi:hypothetical protein